MRTVLHQSIEGSIGTACKAVAAGDYTGALNALGKEPDSGHNPITRSHFFGVRGLCRMMIDARLSEAILDFCTALMAPVPQDDQFAGIIRYNLGLALLLANEPATGASPNRLQHACIEDALVYLTSAAALLAEKAKSDQQAALWSGLAYSLAAEARLVLGRTAKKIDKERIALAANSANWMFVYYSDSRNDLLVRRRTANEAIIRAMRPRPRRTKAPILPRMPLVRLNEVICYTACL